MKISYSTHKPFEIEDGKINVIATNNPVVFQDIVQGFGEINDLINIFDSQYNQLEVQKGIDWLGDLMIHQDINKRYMPAIIKKLFVTMPDEQRNKIHQATLNLDNAMQESLYLANLPIKVTYNFDLKKSLKFTETHLEDVILRDPYDIIKTIVKIHEMCELKTCLTICNVAHYLVAEQITKLAAFLQDVMLPIILIEFTDKNKKSFYKDCNFYYIDEDFVDWY